MYITCLGMLHPKSTMHLLSRSNVMIVNKHQLNDSELSVLEPFLACLVNDFIHLVLDRLGNSLYLHI